MNDFILSTNNKSEIYTNESKKDLKRNDIVEDVFIKNKTVSTNGNEIKEKNLNRVLNVDIKLSPESGKLGIKNLGNTCYMNSALQCLAHTKELIAYFFSEEYKNDMKLLSNDENNSNENKQENFHVLSNEEAINFTNQFALFIKDIWSDSKEVINPVDLRNTFIRLCPQFNNNRQQDAHEVLTMILDCLNQQLNRKAGELERGTSLSLSRHQSLWENFYANNTPSSCGDSVITDLFFGNLKSTIKCIKCNQAYSKYDPFDNLGLSIPYEYKILLYFIPMKKNSKPIKMFIKINDNMQYKEILERVKEIIQVDYKFNSGVFYWVLNNKFISIIDPDERCGDLLSRPAFLFLGEANYTDENINSNGYHSNNNSNLYSEMSNNNHNNIHEKILNNFYVCLNFTMFEDIDKSGNKVASFPRLFAFHVEEDIETLDDKKIILKIFDNLTNYIKNFIQAPEDFKKLQENEFLYYTAKSVENIYENNITNSNNDLNDLLNDKKQKSYICLFCSKESNNYFNCECVNKISANGYAFSLDMDGASSYLLYYLKNRKESFNASTDLIIEINIKISMDILKYRELNRCRDNTQKYIPDTRLDLYQLLKYFTAEEKLTLQDNYFCRNCNMNVVAYKKMEISKYPYILIINLKRFRFESSNFGRLRSSRRSDSLQSAGNLSGEKNENLIEFPINKFMIGDTEYELFAVINHQGKLDSGHYIAICRHPVTKSWIEYDDKTVRTEKIENICTPNAYLLFYKKKKNSFI